VRVFRAAFAAPCQARSMSMAENYVTPRSQEEEDKLIGQRYGVKPTPGCQLQPVDIHGWTVTPPAQEAAKVVPNVATVFGGTGMLGKSLLGKIAPGFTKVKVVTRDAVKAQAALAGIADNIEFIEGSIEEYDQVELACVGSGTVINLVGILFETSTDKFINIQYHGARNVAQAASCVGAVNMLHMSAIGAVDGGLSKYAKSKGWGEGAVRAKFPNAVIFRPSVVFGPEDNFFNQFANFPLPFWPLVGGGHTKFQPVYVEDVTDAMAKCAPVTSQVGHGKTFELGGPDVFTFREILEQIKEITGKGKMMQPIPWTVAEIQGWFMEWMMPVPTVTLDQVKMLQSDNVVAEGAATFSDLGIQAKSVGEIVPSYLK